MCPYIVGKNQHLSYLIKAKKDVAQALTGEFFALHKHIPILLDLPKPPHFLTQGTVMTLTRVVVVGMEMA